MGPKALLLTSLLVTGCNQTALADLHSLVVGVGLDVSNAGVGVALTSGDRCVTFSYDIQAKIDDLDLATNSLGGPWNSDGSSGCNQASFDADHIEQTQLARPTSIITISDHTQTIQLSVDNLYAERTIRFADPDQRSIHPAALVNQQYSPATDTPDSADGPAVTVDSVNGPPPDESSGIDPDGATPTLNPGGLVSFVVPASLPNGPATISYWAASFHPAMHWTDARIQADGDVYVGVPPLSATIE